MKAYDEGEIGKLEGMLAAVPEPGPAPVESWNPPYCGDIGLAIRSNGSWEYQGSPIRRDRLVKLFASVLRKDVDGRTYLVTPAEKIDVKVDDAPFLAIEMEVQGEGEQQKLFFRTNVDDVVQCGRENPLRFAAQGPDGGLKPYVLVRGRLEALLTRALLHDLVSLAIEHPEDGLLGIWSAGVFFPIETALSEP